MELVNNLKDLEDLDRKEIANSPALLDFMVAAYDKKRLDLVDKVRAAKSVDGAQERAKAANTELGAVPGKTVDAVYAVTGDSESGPEGSEPICKPPFFRWDPITQTCVPA